jgi:hypothetical protein
MQIEFEVILTSVSRFCLAIEKFTFSTKFEDIVGSIDVQVKERVPPHTTVGADGDISTPPPLNGALMPAKEQIQAETNFSFENKNYLKLNNFGCQLSRS